MTPSSDPAPEGTDRIPFTPVPPAGTAVELRRAHACGGRIWTVTRGGADVRLECQTCGRAVMLERAVFGRRLRKVVEP